MTLCVCAHACTRTHACSWIPEEARRNSGSPELELQEEAVRPQSSFLCSSRFQGQKSGHQVCVSFTSWAISLASSEIMSRAGALHVSRTLLLLTFQIYLKIKKELLAIVLSSQNLLHLVSFSPFKDFCFFFFPCVCQQVSAEARRHQFLWSH